MDVIEDAVAFTKHLLRHDPDVDMSFLGSYCGYTTAILQIFLAKRGVSHVAFNWSDLNGTRHQALLAYIGADVVYLDVTANQFRKNLQNLDADQRLVVKRLMAKGYMVIGQWNINAVMNSTRNAMAISKFFDTDVDPARAHTWYAPDFTVQEIVNEYKDERTRDLIRKTLR